MDQSIIRNVMFDLGGVLLDWSPDRILDTCFRESTVREAVRRETFLHPDWLELDRGTLLEDDAILCFSERCGRPQCEMVEFLRQVKRSLTPIAETVQLLQDLHDLGVPLYCLSNMTEPCANYLREQYNFFRLFRGIVISGSIKMVKPDPAIYRHALETFRLSAGETVFIDDLARNVEAARQVGLQAIQFLSPEDCRSRLAVLLNGRGPSLARG